MDSRVAWGASVYVGTDVVPATGNGRGVVVGSGGTGLHRSAGARWTLEGLVHGGPIHVTVPEMRRVRHRDVVVHTSKNLIEADRAACGPIPVTSALRTVLDLAGSDYSDGMGSVGPRAGGNVTEMPSVGTPCAPRVVS